jgi:hypothetical protein
MSMSTAGARAKGLAAARALARGDHAKASRLLDAVISEAQRLQQRGKWREAAALTDAYDRSFDRAYGERP